MFFYDGKLARRGHGFGSLLWYVIYPRAIDAGESRLDERIPFGGAATERHLRVWVESCSFFGGHAHGKVNILRGR